LGSGGAGGRGGAAELGIDVGEAEFDNVVHVVEADGEGEFPFGAGESFGHELGEVGEGAGGFEVVVATGYGDEETAEGGVERAVADEIGVQAGSDFLSGFNGAIHQIGMVLVKVTEVGGFVFPEHAALAAVGEEEGA
jgi:hypothetical protein